MAYTSRYRNFLFYRYTASIYVNKTNPHTGKRTSKTTPGHPTTIFLLLSKQSTFQNVSTNTLMSHITKTWSFVSPYFFNVYQRHIMHEGNRSLKVAVQVPDYLSFPPFIILGIPALYAKPHPTKTSFV
jgi:hypothetical protein